MPYRDPERQREYQREWVARRRAAFFAGQRCEDCGSTEGLELHHRDPTFKVSHAIWSWAWERIRLEASKCAVLCSSCHLGYSRVQARAKAARQFRVGGRFARAA